MTKENPDPNGDQYRELLVLCDSYGLHDCQPFLIDYCCLPQQPRTRKEEVYFRKIPPVFQTEFKQNVIILNEGSNDYSERAWCMLGLMLSALLDAIINQDTMDKELAEAVGNARSYVKNAGWSGQSIKKFFGAGLTNRSFKTWSFDLSNVAVYNKMIGTRREIEELFEKKLKVTNENDRQLIIDLVKELCFSQV